MTWFKNLITAKDNETVAIGRVLGLIVFVLFILALPIVAIITVRAGNVPAAEWETILNSLQVYVPAILLSIGGLVGLTSPSEPSQ